MKTLKQFNTLSPDKQCEFAIDLIENESDHDLLTNLIQDGISQGESKDNLVKIILLLKSNRQSFLMGISNNIFENSRFLDTKEEEALNLAFFNSLVKKPTLKGRK